ncbi:MAG: hypothetical protein IKL47_00515 [Clostridia bacterium]|nr:hypothetical protein [Clostridia bacterium]
MDIISRIIMILMSIFSIFSFLFPSVNTPTPDAPDEPSSGIVEEETTETPSTLPQGCKHIGGTSSCTSKAVCIRCGEEYGDGGTHKYTAVVTPPTCTEDGYTDYTCRVCGDNYVGDNKEATGHSYKSRVIEPTCTENGRTVYVCEYCGDSYSENETPKIGHDYKDMGETAPDCVNKGYITFTCTNCGDSYKVETDAALGHNYKAIVTAPTCRDGGYTTYTCPGCDDSYTADETPALGHSFTNYIPDGNASCRYDGTKTAYCDNGCGNISTLIDEGSKLPHVDENNDKHCDHGGEELFMEFTHLTYPAEAVKKAEDWGLSVEKITARADKNDDIYASSQGYADTNGVIISPYYTVKVDGVSVPVYGATVYVGETGKGALHSYSEIYVEKGEYCTFEIEINSGALNITDAKVLPEAYGEEAAVTEGKVTAILSGFGAHTFLFNNENQAYTYTIFVREEVDDAAEIAKLQAEGYTVHVVDGFMTHDYTAFSGAGVAKNVIYLKKGSYVTANHKFEINSDADNNGNPETADDGQPAAAHNGIGLNRFPFVNTHNSSDIKILGYGVLDLTHLDRGERRGVVFSFTNNIEVRGIKIINAPEWSFITYRCNNVTIKDVDIFGYRQNSDAFDICNSNNVTVDGCFARSGDDIFSVKALGGDENATASDITFKNCYAWASKARAFGLFGESHRSVTGVTFKDNFVLMHDATWDENRIPAIGMVIETVDPNNGTITYKDITFENIEISRNKAAAANVLIYNQVTNNFVVDNILFKNISYQSNAVENRIVSYSATGSITNVTFENTTCGGTPVVDSNKMNYFTDEAVNYITVK